MAERESASTGVLRFLPPVGELLESAAAKKIEAENGPRRTAEMARAAVERLRRDLLETQRTENVSREMLLSEAEKILLEIHQTERRTSLRRVINATGVVIHTNLGRAPLSEKAARAVVERAGRYCNLEYDPETGKRGRRGARAEKLLSAAAGAESALIVNNCAAACILVLTALAKGGEAIVSRGELVEIGGDFRIPDVMAESGAHLVEVGATNRTKISDYERAISENTRLIVKVHPSNYRIIGFTETPRVSDLAELARRHNILFYEDAGSGALVDLSEYGLQDEPLISRSVKEGADVVTFSGDKLLGGIQAGLIVGKTAVIERLRKHPLYRALRASKIVYAVLETVLEDFHKEKAFAEIPVLRMLSMSKDEILKRAGSFVGKIKNDKLKAEIISGRSVIGGGSAPAVQPETSLISVSHEDFPANKLEQILRKANPPVIGRILEDKFLLDLRTVFEDEEALLLEILNRI
jgi:L-seryl-tRNA(Ser) seleniumtransferase